MPSLLHARSRPVVRLSLKIAAPGIERVVHHHPVREHFVIIGKVCRKPQRDREQAAALRGQIVARGIGTPDDGRQMIESGILDAIDAQDRVEGAALALVREFDAGYVVRYSAGLLGGSQDATGRHIDELRLWIDEASDQPRTRDAVDFWSFTRHPLPGLGANRSARREVPGHPTGNATLQVKRIDACSPERRRDAFADLMTM